MCNEIVIIAVLGLMTSIVFTMNLTTFIFLLIELKSNKINICNFSGRI